MIFNSPQISSLLLALCSGSTALPLLLPFVLFPLTPISLLKALHPGLANLRIPREEALNIIWLYNRAQLHLVLVLRLLVAFRGLAICGSDEEGEWIRRVEIPERVICDFCCGGGRGGRSFSVECQTFLSEVYAAVAGLLGRLEEGGKLCEELNMSALLAIFCDRIYLFISQMPFRHGRNLPIPVGCRLSW